jgi:hypothetical protein
MRKKVLFVKHQNNLNGGGKMYKLENIIVRVFIVNFNIID